MDNKQQHDGRDAAKVDSKDPSEVEYLHKKYSSFSHAEIKAAVEKYGPVRAEIEAFLNSKS